MLCYCPLNDFSTDVDVNILGHIFEYSLGEIEEITAELSASRGHVPIATQSKATVSRRKKDGVFYTPKYITQYIVENTVGKLCTEKREELNITEIEFDGTYKAKAGKLSAKGKKLFKTLENYKNWLITLKIIDPACGSGAFLNQALIFLIDEHKQIDDIIAELTGEAMRLFDTDIAILENNLYGVDINEESVEIARLSLWLRTAKKGRKLSNLNENIKCGNSLIDDPEIAGNKAFDWDAEFADIMQNGGFDVVIGNPPYLGGRDWKDKDGRDYDYFVNKYQVAEYQFDMYVLFWERGILLTKKGGIISYITPNTWLNNLKTERLREYVLNKTSIIEIADYSDIKVFEDAVVLPVIFILRKINSEQKTKIFIPVNSGNNLVFSHEISQSFWNDEDYKIINIRITEDEKYLNQKIEHSTKKLEDFATVKFGIKLYETGKGIPPQLSGFSKTHMYEANYKVDETYRRFLDGKSINTYLFNWSDKWLKYGENLAAPRGKELFEGDRLLVRRITGKRLIATYLNEDYVTSQLLQIVKPFNKNDAKWILAILNSSLIAFYFKRKYNRTDKAFPEIRIYELRDLPIKTISIKAQQPFIEKANKMLDLNKNLQQKKSKFLNRLTDNFEIDKLSKKKDAFYNFDFKTLVAELKKKKVVLSLLQQDEWEEYFNAYKTEINNLQTQINQTDKEIDQLVYQLYELTEEEIAIVENSIN